MGDSEGRGLYRTSSSPPPSPSQPTRTPLPIVQHVNVPPVVENVIVVLYSICLQKYVVKFMGKHCADIDVAGLSWGVHCSIKSDLTNLIQPTLQP